MKEELIKYALLDVDKSETYRFSSMEDVYKWVRARVDKRDLFHHNKMVKNAMSDTDKH